jgi:hypothetical protein
MTTTLDLPPVSLLGVREDAGRGLAFRWPWLVSVPKGAHARWLAAWLQGVVADAWNLGVLALRFLLGPTPRAFVLWAGSVLVTALAFVLPALRSDTLLAFLGGGLGGVWLGLLGQFTMGRRLL